MPGDVSGIDPETANIARVYDYWLGGTYNFEADRKLARRIEEINPYAASMARRNREFITRAVTWAARHGISQFIDAGTGLPSSPEVHETARVIRPDAVVAYIDDDPLVLAYSAAVLRDVPGVTVLGGDLGDPAAVLALGELRKLIDLEEPVCVILASVLHFFPSERAAAILAGFTRPLVPGSCVIVSVGYAEPELYERAAAEYAAAARGWNHDRDTLTSWFDTAGLELIPPGVTIARAWRAGMPDPRLRPDPARTQVAVARKPLPQGGVVSR